MSRGDKSWVLHGPQGTGKTLHAKAIASMLGLEHIREEWDGRRNTFTLTNTLHIVNYLPAWASSNRRVISIDAALQRLSGCKGA